MYDIVLQCSSCAERSTSSLLCLLRLSLIVVISVLSTGPTLAFAILDYRSICPTIIGDEFDTKVKVINDAQSNDTPRTQLTKDGESVFRKPSVLLDVYHLVKIVSRYPYSRKSLQTENQKYALKQ
jgi:hypothetical protein